MNSSFQLPTRHTLECDYASMIRPAAGAVPLTEAETGAIFRALLASNCTLQELRELVLAVSPSFYISCRQARRLLLLFSADEGIMVQVLISLVNRTWDWYLNEKIVRSSVWQATWQNEVLPRMGSFAMLPWVQPENYTFKMDFRYNEDRLCLVAIFTYENHEEGENIVDVTWDQDYDGQPDLLTYGIPRSWENEPPTSGMMTVTYVCAPEFAVVKERLKMAHEYGGWNTRENTEDDEVRCKFNFDSSLLSVS